VSLRGRMSVPFLVGGTFSEILRIGPTAGRESMTVLR